MTVESELYAALSGVVGGRLYPVEAPAGAQLPYGTYVEFAGHPYVPADGPLSLRRAVYQLSAVDRTFDGVRSVYRQMDAVLNGYQGGSINRMALIGQHVQRDVETATFVQVMDVEIYYREVS
jgi:hypothetical protein